MGIKKKDGPEYRCLQCDKTIVRDRSSFNHRKEHFCSVPCRSEHRSPTIRKSCVTCGLEFKLKISKYIESEVMSVNSGHYCSFKCKPKQYFFKQCLCCGNSFVSYPCHEKSGRAKYCSLKCRKNPSPPEERFLSSFNRSENPTGCWNWTGYVNSHGYGKMYNIDSESFIYAHRYSYQLYIGEIPESLSVAHKCDNALCVNPNHLYAATHKENMADRFDKSRWEKFKNENGIGR